MFKRIRNRMAVHEVDGRIKSMRNVRKKEKKRVATILESVTDKD